MQEISANIALCKQNLDTLSQARLDERLKEAEEDQAWMQVFVQTQLERLRRADSDIQQVRSDISKEMKERPQAFVVSKAIYESTLVFDSSRATVLLN